jgi:2-methylcitrate dehydratase PrpD
MTQINHVIEFIHNTRYADLPPQVQHMAQMCTLDLIGSLCGGRQTRLASIIREHACAAFGGDQASVLLDGRRVSAPGAALANGMSIDALDIHDSHRESLGHAGVHIFPTLLAVAEQVQAAGQPLISGPEFLTALVVGYDIAIRAGVMLHVTVCDYHTSGAWGAVSSAALYSRLHGLTAGQTRHALGIAEYHGPRSQMMRCIDHPTMLKDGSGWGAMAGVSAGMLAQLGFTGAPAITVEADDVAAGWQDLGHRWEIVEQGFKVHAVCWWAQPAIEATLALAREHQFTVEGIEQIEISTFEKATHLNHPRPGTSEEAQYSLPFPVAAALCKWLDGGEGGEAWYGLGPGQLLEDSLHNERILNLAQRVSLVEAPDLTARFPDKFLARAKITLRNGATISGGNTTFRGELDHPLTEEELRTKYRWLAGGILPPERVTAIEQAVFNLPEAATIEPLLALLRPEVG